MPKERKDGLIQKFGPVLISNIKIAVMTDNQYLPMLYTFCKDSFKKNAVLHPCHYHMQNIPCGHLVSPPQNLYINCNKMEMNIGF